jgi:hypothetical protein
MTKGELVIAECAAQVIYDYTSCTERSGQLQCNSRLVGPGGWGRQGSEQKIWLQVSG